MTAFSKEDNKASGDTHFRNGRFAEAIESYKKALIGGSAQEDLHKIYSNRCACFLNTRQYKEALDDANTCVRLKPNWPKGHLRRGNCLERLKRMDDAKEAYFRVLQLDRGNVEAANALNRISNLSSSPQNNSNSSSSSSSSSSTTPSSAPPQTQRSSSPSSAWNMNGLLALGRQYGTQALFRATQWWASLGDETRRCVSIGLIGIVVYFLFFRQSSSSFYSGYSDSHYFQGEGDYHQAYNRGLSWTMWGAILLAAFKLPTAFPQVFGQYAQPFFGMNMATFIWMVNMLTQGRGGGTSFFGGRSMFPNRHGMRGRGSYRGGYY